MKKLLSFLFVSMLLVFFALPAGAATRWELGAAERKQLDTFFSNFAEARIGSFVTNNEIPMETFVQFGVQHNLINRYYDLVNVHEYYSGVKKEAVEAAVYKYFGKRINAVSTNRYKLENNLYVVPKAGGEGVKFAQVAEWNNNGNGVWTGIANVYKASSGFNNPYGTPEEWKKYPEDIPELVARYMFTVTRSPSDADRYVLVEWLEQR
ncbi:MAG: hypothetical protein IJ056_02675 [Acidaminococcaceae bacterium]|nr:hypothetical protein [Acidaminococcaceae bacterium]